MRGRGKKILILYEGEEQAVVKEVERREEDKMEEEGDYQTQQI